MNLAWLFALAAAMFGVWLGARALLDPGWAARLVKLQEAAPGGRAEFRATYGGVFLGLHGGAALFILAYLRLDMAMIGALAAGACAVLALGWAGAGFGRLLSMMRDGAGTRFNAVSVVVEGATALAFALPWIVNGSELI